MPILDFVRGLALGAVDQLNIWLDPFEIREGPADTVDPAALELKAQAAWKDIKENWLHGPNKEFYWHMTRNDLGDMCIWQGFFTATCAFMGDDDALDKALLGMEKLLYLGGDARLSRGADGENGDHAHDPSRKYYTDGGYIFTDDCSESSLIGFLFGLWAVRRCYPASSNFNQRANKMASSVASQLWSDGMLMLNTDGTKAKFGNLKPGLFTAPIRISAGACALLMGETAMGIPADNATGYRSISSSHMGALTHPETHFLFIHPWYQDVIAYAVLLMQATTAPKALQPKFASAMRRMWRKTYKEDCPLYAAMAAEAGCRPDLEDQQRCRRTLEESNITRPDLMNPKMPETVSHQDSDSFLWGVWKWRKRFSRRQIPVWKRPPADFLWQRCPYSLSGSEQTAYNWMDFCLAWSMGRKARIW